MNFIAVIYFSVITAATVITTTRMTTRKIIRKAYKNSLNMEYIKPGGESACASVCVRVRVYICVFSWQSLKSHCDGTCM